MPLDLAAVRRQSRQIALPEIGTEGQERIGSATVALVGDDETIEVAARYLTGAGVGRLRAIGAPRAAGAIEAVARLEEQPRPLDGAGWLEALRGAALVVRSGLDDDPMLRAAVRLGIPVLVTRAGGDSVDLLAFRKHGPCPHAALDVPSRPAAAPASGGAAAVVAGTVAAAEAVWLLAHPGNPPRARHLKLPLDAGDPVVQEIPWRPECFACGGQAVEAEL